MASSYFASSTFKWKYDVFLSFRGEDTRKNFTDHLYYALNQRGVLTFRDDKGLERGKKISELLRAIEESMFSIIILSKNYASSTWCLDELVKIVECIKEKQHTAFPVFYNVDPSYVRNQAGDFKKAFDEHEEKNKEKVQRWRSALKQIANLSGWDLQNRHESQLIQEIVKEILKRLDQLFSSIDTDLVGINLHVKELINKYLEVGLDDVRFIGICGMGGIGKTTIARAVYKMLSRQFDSGCFLENVREDSKRNGLKSLQEKLLSKILSLNIFDDHDKIDLIRRQLMWKKFLLVLDDVNQLEQLETLAGNHAWFGSGSRIIITSRDKHVLISHGVKKIHIYKVGGLHYPDALKLFHLKAFKQEKATNDHVNLTNQIINYANGLPLALKILGSFLCGRSVDDWKSALDRLQKHPDKRILETLRISYDGLAEIDRKIFLDIACFFKRKNEFQVMKMLYYRFGSDQAIGMRELIDKCLITISWNIVCMHDQLQELGWNIVREQHPDEPNKWSRLWLYDDICCVLKNENMGTHEIEGIMLDNPEKDITNMKGKSFSSMSNLKLLKISNVHSSDEHLEYLSNELRFLKWHRYPFKSFPSSFNPENLYELNMCYNNIKCLWDGVKSLKKLKVVKLNHSYKLIRTPDFTEAPNLERLDLESCLSLLEVHWSVGLLKKLTVLNLKHCKKLESFPSNTCGFLTSLKILNLYGCSKLRKLPQDLGEANSLEELDVSFTAIREVPDSIGQLTSLKILNLFGCSNVEKLPQTIGEAKLLEELDVSETAMREVPDSIGQLTKLKTLSFHGCRGQLRKNWRHYFQWMVFRKSSSFFCLRLPPLTGFFSLTKLDLGDCNLLDGAIPSDIALLYSLEILNLRGNNFVTLPESIKQLAELEILCLEKCQMLKSLPQLPPKIVFVGAEDCASLETIPSTLLQLCTSPNIVLRFFNCFKLAENHESKNILADIYWSRWLQKFCYHSSQFYIRLPGSEIPKWFTYWTNDTSIKIQLPPDWLNDDFVGFSFCAVLAPPADYLSVIPLVISCRLAIGPFAFFIAFAIPSFTRIKSDHLCLGFLSYKKIERDVRRYDEFDQKVFLDDNEFENLSTYPEYVGRQVELAIDIQGKDEKYNWHASVKKCGICPVYKQEVNCLGAHHNFEKLPVAESCIIEQSHDECLKWRRISMPKVLYYSDIREFYEGLPLWNCSTKN